MRRILSALLLLCIVGLTSCSQNTVKSEPNYWPTEEWKVSTPEEQGMDSEKLVEMFKYIEKSKEGKLHGLVVVRNGHIVVETYNFPFNDSFVHNTYSVTKSLLSSIIGVAIDEGVIKLDDYILDYFPDMDFENMSEEKKHMTVEQFLTMTSGIEWAEWENSVQLFYEWEQSENQLKYYLDHPVNKDQIGQFNYDTGSAHVLGTIIENETGKTLQEYGDEKIFGKIGMDTLEWQMANEGTTMAGTYSHMTPRDMARFGYLYLHDGKWDGEQIIPKDWVEASLTPQADTGDGNSYGYLFWLLEDDDYEYYMAMGAANQYIMIVPDLDLIAVQTSKHFDFTTLLEDFIIPAIVSDEEIDENEEAYHQLKKMMEED